MIENPLLGQMARYAITGAGLVLAHAVVYWTLAVPVGVPALLANTAAFLVSLAVGYVVHSRWSFAGHGRRDKLAHGYLRYLLVSLAGYALNSFWIWLIVDHWKG